MNCGARGGAIRKGDGRKSRREADDMQDMRTAPDVRDPSSEASPPPWPSPAAQAGPPPVPAAPPVAPAAAQDGSAPLSPEHLQQLDQARRRAKKVLGAGRMALFNGITIGIFAGFALLFALLSPLFGEIDVAALVMAVALGLMTWNEFRGRRLLRRFDSRGPRVLGWNQLALMVLIAGYCAWMIARSHFGPGPYAEDIAREPMLEPTLAPIGKLHRILTWAVYGGVLLGTVLFQGLNALYYFTRRRHLEAYLAETPDWVVHLQRHSAP